MAWPAGLWPTGTLGSYAAEGPEGLSAIGQPQRDLQPAVEVCSAVSVGKHGGLESHRLVSCGDLAGPVS